MRRVGFVSLMGLIIGALLILTACARSSPAATPIPPAPATSAPASNVEKAPAPAAAPAANPTPKPAAVATAIPKPSAKKGGILREYFSIQPNYDVYQSVFPSEPWRYLGQQLIRQDPITGDPMPVLIESWEYRSETELILHVRKGVPAVIVAIEEFERPARMQLKVMGMSDLPLVILPRRLAGLQEGASAEMADFAFEGIVKGLTQPIAKEAPPA